MNAIFLLATASLVEQAQSTGRQFGFNTADFLAQVISFLLVAVLLRALAYKPIVAMLEERRQRIAEGVANAEKIQQELARTQTERQEILKQANQQANHLVEEARAAALRLREEETRKAKMAAEQILAHAREASARERALARDELRKEIGRLVVATAAQVTGRVMTPEDQERLIAETARQLAA